MKIAIMQPYFFPYLGYWQLINSADKFVILDDVNFIKKGWIHKNNIISNGTTQSINVCVNKASQNKLIKDLYLSDEHDWKGKLIKKIEYAYRTSPNYNSVSFLLEDIIFNKEKNLSKYLTYSIKKICEYLNISTEIVESSSKYFKGQLKGQERIISICSEEKADVYINAIGGMELYKRQDFLLEDINLKFIKSLDSVNKLSIIDEMMFNSTDQVKQSLNSFSLE